MYCNLIQTEIPVNCQDINLSFLKQRETVTVSFRNHSVTVKVRQCMKMVPPGLTEHVLVKQKGDITL